MQSYSILNIKNKFDVNVSDDWSFAESRSVEHLTHGYHRYPAKFIPTLEQLYQNRILEWELGINNSEYSVQGSYPAKHKRIDKFSGEPIGKIVYDPINDDLKIVRDNTNTTTE